MTKRLNRTTASRPQTRPVKVLQFGGGNFLRGFANWMIDLANEKADFNGAVQIIKPTPQGMGDIVNEQQGLYHVILNGIRQGKLVKEIRLVSCVDSMINPHEDFQAFLRTAENPDLQFVISNTTEAGIAFDPKDTSPDQLSSSFPGKLTTLLYHRYKFFKGASEKALTIIPCELIEKNGEALRDTIVRYASLWNLPFEFKTWIEEHTLFCNTLVDRIVPGFPKETIKDIEQETGYEDNLVVTAEPFHLWVIEPKTNIEARIQKLRKDFPMEATGLDVMFVNDLTPYRTRKVRILNGAHTTMVPVAYLRGLRTVREAVEDPFTGDFIRKAIHEEIIPTLDLPKEELQKFADDVVERFLNPSIRHELLSIALNSISKYQVRVLPTVLEYVKRTGKPPKRLLYSLAALIRFYKGEWQGEAIPLKDTQSILDFFKKVWTNNDAGTIVKEVLSNEALWGTDLTKVKGVAEEIEKGLKELW